MAGTKNTAANAVPASSGDAKPAVDKDSNPRLKSVHLLEGLLDKNDRLVVDRNDGRNKIKTVIKNEVKKRGWLKKLRVRHTMMIVSFALCVALPASLASFYMIFLAADQYNSSASFSVRSIDSAGSADILGMFTQASSGNTGSDSYILMDYLHSPQMLADVEKNFDLEKIYAARGLDYFYGMSSNMPIEDKVAYWRDMVSVNYDHTSGIMQLNVKAFDPADAQALAGFILQESDKLVNQLSAAAREGVLAGAREEMLLTEGRLTKARNALRDYRDVSQEVDPVEGAKLALQLIGGLEQQLVQMNADLATAKTQMGDDTPRIRVLKARIASVEKQITTERQRLGSGTPSETAPTDGSAAPDVAGRIQQYESLETEREFAERAYTASLGSLEKARLDANNRQRYLAVFIQPTLSQMAQYPSRIVNSLLVALGLLFAWSVCVMGYYNIRDRT